MRLWQVSSTNKTSDDFVTSTRFAPSSLLSTLLTDPTQPWQDMPTFSATCRELAGHGRHQMKACCCRTHDSAASDVVALETCTFDNINHQRNADGGLHLGHGAVRRPTLFGCPVDSRASSRILSRYAHKMDATMEDDTATITLSCTHATPGWSTCT